MCIRFLRIMIFAVAIVRRVIEHLFGKTRGGRSMWPERPHLLRGFIVGVRMQKARTQNRWLKIRLVLRLRLLVLARGHPNPENAKVAHPVYYLPMSGSISYVFFLHIITHIITHKLHFSSPRHFPTLPEWFKLHAHAC